LGGGTSSNINLGILSPPSTSATAVNITAIPFVPPNNGNAQDIVDIIIDPIDNSLYALFNSLSVGALNNKIYKNTTPYSAASFLWNTSSGFIELVELQNRPYLIPGNSVTENSANILALNPTYLFYWDGKNLKAFNKATGAGVGTPLITTNTAKMSGGIYADACNNVYVGDLNGTIKVYNFNGTTFSDTPTDISIAGYATKSVYDIAYNDADKLLYASGDGFVAAFDIAATCPNNNIGFSLNIVSNCATASATAAIAPAPPTGSVINYTLFIGTTQIASNTTGIFTGLLPQTNYKITATINQTCSGVQVSSNFTLPASALPTITTPITYCQGATATALTATGTNLLWYTTATGGTGTATAPIPNTTAVGTTAYYVSQTTTGNCESPRAQINVQITAVLAAPIITTPIIYCQAATATALTATGTNLQWYTNAIGGTGISIAPIPSTTTVGITAYYVSQSATASNCESPRAQINVQVTPSPVIPIITTPITYCQGAVATALTATGTNLLWYTSASGGGTGTATAPIPNTTTVGTTAYYVSQSNAGGSCESPRAQINVNITPLLTANAGNTVTIAAGTTTQLNATATPGADYTWSSNIAPISLSNINILNPIANPLQTTTYLLTVKDVVGNCSAVSSGVQVVVIGTQNCINIRNAFTPNGDGINDKWLIYDQDNCLTKDGASVQVYNRYGSKVYENNIYKNTWDGTYNNKPLPDGTYYAVIVFTLVDGKKQYARSDVTIVR
jgi:gliding motility-associated-like protein